MDAITTHSCSLDARDFKERLAWIARLRMITIPNQSSVAKAWQEFDDAGRMKPSPFYDRVVDVMEELVKFTLLVRGRSDYLVDRYSERKGAGAASMLAKNANVVEGYTVDGD